MGNIDLNPKKWEIWLRVNAEKHFLEGKRHDAWLEVSGAHDPRKMLSEQISLHYKRLSPEQRVLFKEGLVSCLLHLPQEEDYFDIFILFIQLTVDCECYEIVDSIFFEKMVFRGKLGSLNKKNIKHNNKSICLFNLIISTLRHFSRYGEGTRIVYLVQKMAASPLFPPRYAYLAFLLLCKARPNKLLTNWEIVRVKHFEFVNETSNDERDPAAYIVLRSEFNSMLEPREIADFMINIKVKGVLDDYLVEDEWIIDVLFNKSKGPLKITIEDDILNCEKDEYKVKVACESSLQLSEGFYEVISNNINMPISYVKTINPNILIRFFYKNKFSIKTLKKETSEAPYTNESISYIASGIPEAV